MRPVAIFQHAVDVEPGYFQTWLTGQGIPFQLFHPYRGDAVPEDPAPFSGICLMGGPMSANDPLDWLAAEERLVAAADSAARPVIGHCLGGQLLAKAFGAAVSRNEMREIGWGRVQVTDRAVAVRWLGEAVPDSLEMFQWHGDTFAVPAAARNFLASELCPRQAFVIERDGFAHLGMQFHCEMTPALIQAWLDDRSWLAEVEAERRANGGPGVQDAGRMTEGAPDRCAAMNQLAARLYSRWREGLVA